MRELCNSQSTTRWTISILQTLVEISIRDTLPMMEWEWMSLRDNRWRWFMLNNNPSKWPSRKCSLKCLDSKCLDNKCHLIQCHTHSSHPCSQICLQMHQWICLLLKHPSIYSMKFQTESRASSLFSMTRRISPWELLLTKIKNSWVSMPKLFSLVINQVKQHQMLRR